MDELDAKISSLTQVLNSPIEDDFSNLVSSRLKREGHLRHILLIVATSVGLAVSLTPITRLVVSISDRLLGAPAQILSMSSASGVLLSALVCFILLIWEASLKTWEG